jgi:Concanavalin A-like lectin/glucanases superfamily
MNMSAIVLGVVLVVVSYIFYLYWKSRNLPLVSSTTLNIANQDIIVPASLKPESSRYTYSVWVNVNTWDNTKEKPLFSRMAVAAPVNPYTPQVSVYFDRTAPKLYATISPSVLPADGTVIPPMVITDSFPLQKWTHVLLSVDNNYVDMYLDGKLVKSVKLSYIPTSPGPTTVPIRVGKTKEGNSVASDIFMSKFQLWSTPFSPQEAWNEYMKGNSSSMFGGLLAYGATLSLSKDNTVTNTVTLF